MLYTVPALAACLVACGPQITVETQATSAHLDRYRTFAFETDADSPAEFAPSSQTAYVKERIRQIAEVLLRNKGYRPAAGAPADLVIHVSAGRREREILVFDSSAPRFARRGRRVEEDIFEGAFTIEAVDTSAGGVVWRGSGRLKIQPGVVDEEDLRLAVREVLASLPSR